VIATLRREKGHDIAAACGQLRLQAKLSIPTVNGATGVSDMAGKAARVAVESCGSSRDTMELMGSAT